MEVNKYVKLSVFAYNCSDHVCCMSDVQVVRLVQAVVWCEPRVKRIVYCRVG